MTMLVETGREYSEAPGLIEAPTDETLTITSNTANEIEETGGVFDRKKDMTYDPIEAARNQADQEHEEEMFEKKSTSTEVTTADMQDHNGDEFETQVMNVPNDAASLMQVQDQETVPEVQTTEDDSEQEQASSFDVSEVQVSNGEDTIAPEVPYTNQQQPKEQNQDVETGAHENPIGTIEVHEVIKNTEIQISNIKPGEEEHSIDSDHPAEEETYLESDAGNEPPQEDSSQVTNEGEKTIIVQDSLSNSDAPMVSEDLEKTEIGEEQVRVFQEDLVKSNEVRVVTEVADEVRKAIMEVEKSIMQAETESRNPPELLEQLMEIEKPEEVDAEYHDVEVTHAATEMALNTETDDQRMETNAEVITERKEEVNESEDTTSEKTMENTEGFEESPIINEKTMGDAEGAEEQPTIDEKTVEQGGADQPTQDKIVTDVTSLPSATTKTLKKEPTKEASKNWSIDRTRPIGMPDPDQHIFEPAKKAENLLHTIRMQLMDVGSISPEEKPQKQTMVGKNKDTRFKPKSSTSGVKQSDVAEWSSQTQEHEKDQLGPAIQVTKVKTEATPSEMARLTEKRIPETTEKEVPAVENSAKHNEIKEVEEESSTKGAGESEVTIDASQVEVGVPVHKTHPSEDPCPKDPLITDPNTETASGKDEPITEETTKRTEQTAIDEMENNDAWTEANEAKLLGPICRAIEAQVSEDSMKTEVKKKMKTKPVAKAVKRNEMRFIVPGAIEKLQKTDMASDQAQKETKMCGTSDCVIS